MKHNGAWGLLCFAALLCAPASAADTTLVASGSVWRYLDNGSDQGTAWRAVSFADSAWKTGAAQLGYGDGDEATLVSYGPNSSAKYPTTYFRYAFTAANPALFTKLTLQLLRDDGAVVYLNGTEVFRANMPAGTVGYLTYASSAIGGADETTWYSQTVSPALLVAGTNVLAVEIHQANATSSDLSFDARLIGSDSAASITRGPYLQRGTPASIVVRWRTDVPTDSRVRYGPSPLALASFTDNPASSTEHEVQLTGLTANTDYCYSVGTTAQTIGGGDANHCFRTSPPVGSTQAARFWVLGDPGTGASGQLAVRNAYTAYTGATRTDGWLMLGDNAYQNGLDSEYQTRVFDIYPDMFRKSVLWPAIGNHDTAQSATPPPTLPYFQIFTLPTAGEAGGAPSGTEKYYSYDYGNVHFICLDSMSSDRSPTGPMAIWLQQDLAATNQKWKIAYWHHPPYTKGTHDSDVEIQSREMRANIVPILEAGNVDLVMVGHSHNYERSFLIDGHYGLSTTFTNAMKKDGGDGRLNGTGPYAKPGSNGHEGTVYLVAGVSGQIGGFIGTYPAMYLSVSQFGSLVLDVAGDQLDVKFLRDTGAIGDYFTMRKGVAPVPPPADPTGLGATAISTTQINLNWTDNANNETGYRVERATGAGSFSVIATLPANAVSYSNTGLSSGVTYTYRVAAFNGSGDSGYSNTATATTQTVSALPLITSTAIWRYLDNGSNQGTAWRAVSFSDSTWKTGAAELGYGDGGEATVVSYGNNQKKKYITTYFRRAFTVTDPAQIATLALRLIRDDGAVVYLNGTEVFRSNMPTGSIGYRTTASTAIEGAAESTWIQSSVNRSLLLTGTNVIAVEIHQNAQNSSDISFNLELTANAP